MGNEYLASGDITLCAVGSLGDELPGDVEDRVDDDGVDWDSTTQ